MKKATRIMGAAVRGILLATAAVMLLLTLLNITAVLPQAPGLFGYRAYVVLSDSMDPIFQAGDLVFTKPVDPQELQIGDIIAFHSSDPSIYNEVVTHRIQEITEYRGEKAYITAGDQSGVPDAVPAQSSHVLGQYCAVIPKLGYLFSFLKTPAGFLIFIFAPLFLLMAYEIARMLYGIKRYRRNMRQTMEREYDLLKAQEVKLKEEQEQLVEDWKQLAKEQQAVKRLAESLESLKEQMELRLKEPPPSKKP